MASALHEEKLNVKTFGLRFDYSPPAWGPMPADSSPTSFADWQALALQDPQRAAREFSTRLERLSPAQRKAMFAWTLDDAQIAAGIARVAGTIAPFAGVPYVVKDLFATGVRPIRAGSRFPEGVLPSPSRESKFPHVLRGFGAVLAGATQLHEFAYGLTGENPHYGHCEHPRFIGRTAGGSSSGSAAAVAAGIVPLALGTDTAGSIRVPAAFCGLFGFRTRPQDPLLENGFPLAPSFDTAGWFTRTSRDLLTVNRFLVGRPHERKREPRGCFLDFKALGQTADLDVAAGFRAAAERIANPAEPEARDQLVRSFEGAADAYVTLSSREAAEVHAKWLDVHRELYDPAVWARIDRGRHWSTAELDTASARKAALLLTWQSYFLTYDFLVLPATPFPALALSDCTQANRERLLALTAPASLAGLPVLSIPVALPSGLTTGLQVIVAEPQSATVAWALSRFDEM